MHLDTTAMQGTVRLSAHNPNFTADYLALDLNANP